jgi:hypothetical protein
MPEDVKTADCRLSQEHKMDVLKNLHSWRATSEIPSTKAITVEHFASGKA